APERNRERSIGHQIPAWNVGFMERLQINNSRLFLLASRISKVLAWRMAAPAVFDHDSRSAIQHPGKPAWQSPDRLRKITIDHLG
ncbi:hypothetical protein, partial [Pseudomonas lundensis]|uniref:hypothetical protein n=1 Tax=Pseudomonas lundensis TaxID=86185 RepID=UPI001BAEFA0E